MQPYFLPYIGYWQLLNAVDSYVIYDDVNYIKGGWINRNRILIDGEVKYFNVQLKEASPNKLINEVCVDCNEKIINKKLRTIENAYNKAPQFERVYPLIKNIMQCNESNLADFLTKSIVEICKYLNIDTKIIVSSELPKDNSVKGQAKVLDICQLLGASEYYNAIGGQELYSFEEFKSRGIELKFLKTEDVIYNQGKEHIASNLSILDVLMHNSVDKISEYLHSYNLITER